MLETYKATLQGNKIEWQGEKPKALPLTVSVFVTILEEEKPRRKNNGKKMAEVLSKIASLNGETAAIENPSEWQREQRQDCCFSERED
jgi:hypothetical protein